MASRFSTAKGFLQDDVLSVIGDLFGAGAQPKNRHGKLWNVVNPWRSGARARQMVVWLDGNRVGAWRDFVSGETGDVIDLVAFCRDGRVDHESRMKALEWIEDRYNIRSMDPKEKTRAAKRQQERRKKLEVEAVAARKKSNDRARRMYYSAQESIAGTVAETYLRSARGIDLDAIKFPSHALRFMPRAEYWMAAPKDANGKRLAKGPHFPALISAMRNCNGELQACHLTFLARDGSGKAPLFEFGNGFSAKLMWPETAGSMISLCHGETGLSLADAAAEHKSGLLAVTEGIEDGLTVASARSELRISAAGSLSGLMGLFDHPAISGWLIFKDNDWGKPQAQKQFDSAIIRLRGFGKPVEIIAIPPDWGKDVNDAING